MFEISFTAVHKAMPKCMPEESLAPWQSDESLKLKTDGVQLPVGPVKSIYRGFESRRMLFEHIASGLVTAGNGTDDGVRKHARTLLKNAIAQLKKRSFVFISNALLALFGNGYRVSTI